MLWCGKELLTKDIECENRSFPLWLSAAKMDAGLVFSQAANWFSQQMAFQEAAVSGKSHGFSKKAKPKTKA